MLHAGICGNTCFLRLFHLHPFPLVRSCRPIPMPDVSSPLSHLLWSAWRTCLKVSCSHALRWGHMHTVAGHCHGCLSLGRLASSTPIHVSVFFYWILFYYVYRSNSKQLGSTPASLDFHLHSQGSHWVGITVLRSLSSLWVGTTALHSWGSLLVITINAILCCSVHVSYGDVPFTSPTRSRVVNIYTVLLFAVNVSYGDVLFRSPTRPLRISSLTLPEHGPISTRTRSKVAISQPSTRRASSACAGSTPLSLVRPPDNVCNT